MTEAVLALRDERVVQLEKKLATATRVAAEAIRMLTDEQLVELRHVCAALEVGESESNRPGGGA